MLYSFPWSHSLSEVNRSIRSHVGAAVILPASSASNKFDLDTSGVAGFFGGDVALSAMVTSHIYAGRRWLCWYNQPGSFEVARRYGQLAQSRFWDALYPGPNVDPASLFHFHTKEHGPEYIYFDEKEPASSYTTGYRALRAAGSGRRGGYRIRNRCRARSLYGNP